MPDCAHVKRSVVLPTRALVKHTYKQFLNLCILALGLFLPVFVYPGLSIMCAVGVGFSGAE